MGEEKRIVVVSGKRKTAVARVKLSEGKGNVLYNGSPIGNLDMFHKLALEEPKKITEQVLGGFNFDIEIKTRGGGKEAQIHAARLGIAKALIKFTESLDLRKAFLDYDRHLLIADVRRKEVCKPGDSKARARRQKSYR